MNKVPAVATLPTTAPVIYTNARHHHGDDHQHHQHQQHHEHRHRAATIDPPLEQRYPQIRCCHRTGNDH